MQGQLAVSTGQDSISNKEQCEGSYRLALKRAGTGSVSQEQYGGVSRERFSGMVESVIFP